MTLIDRMQEAIRGESLDGWLFCNFAHRDSLTDSILGLNTEAISSRRWFYFVPASGTPLKIVHAIEKNILESLPGSQHTYAGKTELETLLVRLRGRTVAVLSDPNIQVLSTMDASSAALVAAAGAQLASAAPLIQRMKGVLDAKGIESHEYAAKVLYRIVHESWNLIREAFGANRAITEGEVQDFMLRSLADAGLVTDHPPIVGAGTNSGDPHYTVPEANGAVRGKRIEAGDVVQFDIWAKKPDGIFADISWIGYCGKTVPESVAKRAKIVFDARDLVFPAIGRAFAGRGKVTGSELDAEVRSFLLAHAPAETVQHRTGHGIDTSCHGSGVNLDSVEFPDTRELLEGSCFSVEPGIYFSDCGFRTEIDIYIANGKPVISGGPIQHSLLTLQDTSR
jgi:Xaa-Pro aminopeptidase